MRSEALTKNSTTALQRLEGILSFSVKILEAEPKPMLKKHKKYARQNATSYRAKICSTETKPFLIYRMELE
ncbi:MAG: hypothetical protein H6576_07340 [Lewinellaceae bacterium]|nr:hypothetical protein [Saprospiraceae bacterium]MCB9343492.1 hypothetical protein [Lewinellaceae bacterium]